jgi:hypothetical protein
MQLAIVASRALVATRCRPLVASRIAQTIGLSFQHRVQRLLDRPPHDPTQVITHPFVVDPDHIAQRRAFAILFHGGSLLNWLSSVVSQRRLNQSGSHRPNLRKILYVIHARSHARARHD